MRLGLGTVRFGLNYGLGDFGEKISHAEAKRIIELADSSGISFLDTASSYGDSEKILGQVLIGKKNFKLTTKTPYFTNLKINKSRANELRETLLSSLGNLRRKSLHCLLVHNPSSLLGDNGDLLFNEMLKCKDQGLIEKIGISVYEEREIKQILGSFPVDLVQLPISIIDQRKIKGGCLEHLSQKGIEIHARSIFLQGLILMSPQKIPKYFTPIIPVLEKMHNEANELGVSVLHLAVNFIRNIKELDCVLFGVGSCAQLTEILAAFKTPINAEIDYSSYALDDPAYVNPRLWPES